MLRSAGLAAPVRVSRKRVFGENVVSLPIQSVYPPLIWDNPVPNRFSAGAKIRISSNSNDRLDAILTLLPDSLATKADAWGIK